MDLQIDSTGDLEIVDGDFVFVDDGEAVAQHITMRLRTYFGESPYDRSAGVPYIGVILQPNTPTFSREEILNREVLNTPGVTGSKMTVTLDTTTHTLHASGTAEGVDGPVEFQVEIG